ncbi:MAG: hypothetical protein ACR2JY_08100 [Chloroflexota bacterium]
MTLAALEAHDPHGDAGGTWRRFCCPLPGCAAVPVVPSRRALSVHLPTGAWVCHRCGARGRLEEYGPDDAARRGEQPGRRRPAHSASEPDWRKPFEAALPLAGTPGAAYLADRGIAPALAAPAGVRFARDWFGLPELLFPLRDLRDFTVAVYGQVITGGSPQVRLAGEPERGAFSAAGAMEHAPLVVIETPLGALALATVGVPFLALGGTVGPGWPPIAAARRRVALELAAGEAGDQATERLRRSLELLEAHVERWQPLGDADWPELLRRDGPDRPRRALVRAAAGRPCGSFLVGAGGKGAD